MLLGRGTELDRIDRLLGDARRGDGGALLISGEAGIGKTALLADAHRRAEGMRVIEAVGIEAEARLPFAALGEVAEPLLENLGALPPPQAAAIEAALALAADGPAAGDRLAACMGFLGLLRIASEDEPVLLLVDDAHWLDSASAECIGYAARRLQGSAVALVAAARNDPEYARTLGGRLPELELAGLGRDQALALLRSLASDLSTRAAESLLGSAAGNPLALIELPTLLTPEQRLGQAPIAPVPVPRNGLREAFERRLDGLDPQARLAALVASAAFARSLAPVVGACRELGVEAEGLERAEEARVLELGPDQVAFSHPLLRGVVYESASGTERRRAHQALAEHAGEDARAWHLAAATIGPDAEAATALEAAAARAGARGAHLGAADALERAAGLSDDDDQRSSRLLQAGLAAALGGSFDRSVGLLDPIAADDSSPMRTPVRHLLALVAVTGGIRPAAEHQANLSAEAEWAREANPAMSAVLFADAGLAATVASDCVGALDAAERANAVLPEDAGETARCQVLSILGMALAMRGRTAEATKALDETGELLPRVDSVSPTTQSISFSLHARIGTGQAAILREELLRLGAAAREAQVHGQVPHYLLVGADAAYRLGDWDAAAREIAEAVEIAEHFDQRAPLSIALLIKARLDAARGETETAAAEAERGIEVGSAGEVAALWGAATRGFLALTAGDAEAAIAALEEANRRSDVAALDDPIMIPWPADLVEAYARAGRDRDAARAAAELGERAERNGTPLAAALAGRCRGLTADDGFDSEFKEAIAMHDRAGAPFERARTLLAWGGRLHRSKRRREARERLREALAGFEALGARPWAERTRAELKAAGALRREPVGDPDELTAQEVRVARAVSRGATNREVAAEMFLSPKTIEFHLGRVYRKLGIGSRTELASLVADGRLDTPSAEADREGART